MNATLPLTWADGSGNWHVVVTDSPFCEWEAAQAVKKSAVQHSNASPEWVPEVEKYERKGLRPGRVAYREKV